MLKVYATRDFLQFLFFFPEPNSKKLDFFISSTQRKKWNHASGRCQLCLLQQDPISLPELSARIISWSGKDIGSRYIHMYTNGRKYTFKF